MRGRYVGHTSVGLAPRTGRDVEAFPVYRHGHEAGSGAGEGGPGAGVAGVLHPRGVARIQQHPGREIEGLLRARDHDHLLR